MKKYLHSLSAKLICSILLLSIMLCSGISYMGYQEFTAVLEQQYNQTAYEIAETAKTYLNADRLDEYLQTQTVDADYLEIQKQLDALVVSADAVTIYVTKLSDDYLTSTYIFDAVHPDTGFDRYALGYTATDMDAQYTDEVEKMMTTGTRSAVYFYSSTAQSGAHTTAAIPIRTSDGEIVAMLGVEKAMTTLDSARHAYVWHVIGVTTIAVLLFLMVYIAFLRRTVVTPIVTVTEESRRFAEDNTPNLDLLQGIRRQDEIGTLAQAISKMETEIVRYIQNLTAVTAEKERIGAELHVATQIQTSMLPRIFPAFPDRDEFDIYATMEAAKEVGGDFYDFFLIDRTHLGIVIADVSGKGVPAALFMVIAKTLIKNQAQAGVSPAQVFEIVNDQLCENNAADMFVTAFMGVLELSTNRFVYVNAGHNPPLLSCSGQPYARLPVKRGFVLAGLPHIKYQSQEITLGAGDRLFLYTDGVTEALGPQDALYSEDRLQHFLNSPAGQASSLREILHGLRADIDRFADGTQQADDITMLLLEIHAGGAQNG